MNIYIYSHIQNGKMYIMRKIELIKMCYQILIKTIVGILGDNVSKPGKQLNTDGGIVRIQRIITCGMKTVDGNGC